MEIMVILILMMGGAALSSIGLGGDDDSAGAEPLNGEDPPVNKIEGTPNGDFLAGTDGPDHIFGFEGGDTLEGGAGDDTLEGGDGFDRLFGGPGNDFIDVLGGAYNTAFGGEGEDTLIGAKDGVNFLAGGGHEDLAAFEEVGHAFRFDGTDRHADVLEGGDFLDYLFFSGADQVTGGGGIDEFRLHDIEGILEDGKPAVVTDFETEEVIEVMGKDVAPSWVTEGNNVLIVVDGLTVAVLENAASFFTDSNLVAKTYPL